MVEQDKSQVYVYHDGKFDMMRQSTGNQCSSANKSRNNENDH